MDTHVQFYCDEIRSSHSARAIRHRDSVLMDRMLQQHDMSQAALGCLWRMFHDARAAYDGHNAPLEGRGAHLTTLARRMLWLGFNEKQEDV